MFIHTFLFKLIEIIIIMDGFRCSVKKARIRTAKEIAPILFVLPFIDSVSAASKK